MGWEHKALCVGDTNTFFPKERPKASYERAIRKAKFICSKCPVQTECLNAALQRVEPVGIWGGKTPEERSNHRLSTAISASKAWQLQQSTLREQSRPVNASLVSPLRTLNLNNHSPLVLLPAVASLPSFRISLLKFQWYQLPGEQSLLTG